MTTSRPGVLDDLAPEVLGYSVRQFSLRDDLGHLDAVHAADAPEAAVLYCARVLEVTAGDALRRVGQEPNPNLFSNLQALEHLNRIGGAVRYWAHALRRLGNSVRHVYGRVGTGEASLAILFTEGWLDWFFRRYSHGPKLSALTDSQGPLRLTGDDDARNLMRSLETLSDGGEYALPADRDETFYGTAVFPALAAEILIGRKRDAEARSVLDAALQRFPDDLRLRQMEGLYWSRQDRPDAAIEWLEPLNARYPDDDETVGILAGAYKRKWHFDRLATDFLAKSQRAYRDAWKKSGRKNAYLGINAATTALWLGWADESRRLAAEVEGLLRRRAAALPADLGDAGQDFRFWDQVTLAEALLLLGDQAAAGEVYEDAFARNPGRVGDIDVCRRQRDEILRTLGSPPRSV